MHTLEHHALSYGYPDSLTHAAQTPTMAELFKAGSRHINIPRKIGSKYIPQLWCTAPSETHRSSHWRPGTSVWEKWRGDQPIILQEWLDGKGRKPTTWATLVKVLKDIEMGELAKSTSKRFITNQDVVVSIIVNCDTCARHFYEFITFLWLCHLKLPYVDVLKMSGY